MSQKQTLRGNIAQALKYGGELLFKKIAPQLGNFAINTQNVAHKLGVSPHLTERALDSVLNAIHRKNETFDLSQIGKAIIPTSVFDYPSRSMTEMNRTKMESKQYINPYQASSAYEYSHERPNTNAAWGIGNLGSTPSRGMNSRDLAPAYIGDRQEIEEQRRNRPFTSLVTSVRPLEKRIDTGFTPKKFLPDEVYTARKTRVKKPKKGTFSLVI